MMSARPPKTIESYMSRHRLPASALRDDGRLTLLIDEKYRVHMHPALAGRVVFEARIVTLPMERVERDRALEHALRLACTRLQHHADGIVVDRHVEALWLQQTVTPTEEDDDIDEALADFVNGLARWIEATKVYL